MLSITAAAAVAVQPTPVVWHFLGYGFEAASMIAAIGAAVTTRVIISARAASVSRKLDAAVLMLVLLTTAAVVVTMHANLLTGLLWGTGLAAIGEGLIRIAEKYVNKGLDLLGVEAPPAPTLPAAPPPARADDAAAIEAAMQQLGKMKGPGE